MFQVSSNRKPINYEILQATMVKRMWIIPTQSMNMLGLLLAILKTKCLRLVVIRQVTIKLKCLISTAINGQQKALTSFAFLSKQKNLTDF